MRYMLRRRLSPSTLIATIALITATTGTAVAAGATDAQAAGPTVAIVQKDGNIGTPTQPFNTVNSALMAWPSGAVTSVGSSSLSNLNIGKHWIKHVVNDQFATYESVKFPGRCLEVRSISSETPMFTGPCQPFLATQRWTQGFAGGSFRPLQNQDSGRVLTRRVPATTASVVQAADQGLTSQMWKVHQL